MKNTLLVFWLMVLCSCSKIEETPTIGGLQDPCQFTNEGIYTFIWDTQSYKKIKIDEFIVDSVVLKNNQFSIWMTEKILGEKFILDLWKEDKSKINTQMYSLEDSALKSKLIRDFSSFGPFLNFQFKSLSSSTENFEIYSNCYACIYNFNEKFGIVVNGIAVLDKKNSNRFVQLTLNLENQKIISR